MNEERLYLDIHVIQTLPPSNANRDDTGSPKTALYGSVRRARVSSQAWKKAMRDFFKANTESENLGVRSLNLPAYIKKHIMELDPSIDEEKAMGLAGRTLKSAGINLKKDQTEALFFIGEKQAKAFAKLCIEGEKEKKTLQKALGDNPAIDIALFGRMVASDPKLNEDASAQIAHAISTHGVQTEYDYFTAIDEFSAQEHAGAGMLGTIEFTSSSLYRYGNVALHEFDRQMGGSDMSIDATKLFVEAFIKSMPTGKSNTFANQTLPQAVVVALRMDRPVNLVTAFENPIKTREGGYVDISIKRLAEEMKIVERFSEEPILVLNIGADGLGEDCQNITELLDRLGETLTTLL